MDSRRRVDRENRPDGRAARTSISYVLDTHAFYWYLQDPDRLSAAADAVFRLGEAEGAQLLVPAIVVAEIFYLTKKDGRALLPSKLTRDIDETPGFSLSVLDEEVLRAMEPLHVPEMHDRLIAAHALVHEAPVVTKDRALHDLAEIQAVW